MSKKKPSSPSENPHAEQKAGPKPPSIFSLLGPYRSIISALVVLAIASNVLTLLLPRQISHAIDAFIKGTASVSTIGWQFGAIAFVIFLLTYAQSVVQTYASERVARDLRSRLATKISQQSYRTIQQLTPGKLLTNLTADIDSIKLFVAQAIVSLVSSLCIIFGASILLLLIDWKLALAVLTIVPVIGGTFFVVFGKVRELFKKSREVIDWLNRIISESILGAALVRVLHSQAPEEKKFSAANQKAQDFGMQILKMFSIIIPVITFVSGLGTIIILALGGHFVINGSLTLGDFAAFNSYVALIIFPILIIGFMTNIIAQATASYQRVQDVLNAPEIPETGTRSDALAGGITFDGVTLTHGDRQVLKHVSFDVKAGSRTAIIGPTAAGKTQLLYLTIGLIAPNEGKILFDGHEVREYDHHALHRQIGFVFQDSIMFNLTLRENIAFNTAVTEENMKRAIETAELADFVATLPDGLDTVVSERGTSLSGGQKQRVMLARALALNPKILLLDDFTARVDTATEQKILANVAKNYPQMTLVSVTQKIAAIEHYDQIMLLMEGELIAAGTHEHLMETCPEYVQIYNSQRSTNHYESQS